jgi:hypothetical protein
LGELTASIAHEVNQPLGAILTTAETALRWLGRVNRMGVRIRVCWDKTVSFVVVSSLRGDHAGAGVP